MLQTLSTPGTPPTAFGVNDKGNVVGQFTSAGTMPGFFLANRFSPSAITITALWGRNTVNAQGINFNGLVASFYVGTDGQDHGFMANVGNAMNGLLTGTAIVDPTIPNVAGEPGARFVFSQILGINDKGNAVGYYGDFRPASIGSSTKPSHRTVHFPGRSRRAVQ